MQHYYAVPAVNTTIERLFSSSKNIVIDKRTSLGAEKINKLLFLQKYLASVTKFDKYIINEAPINSIKRKIADQDKTSIETPSHNQEQIKTSTTAKKMKKDETAIIILYDDEDVEEEEDTDENDEF